MTIDHVADGDAGDATRAKINAVINAANAQPTSVPSTSADGAHSSPGEDGDYFSTDFDGAPEDMPSIPSGQKSRTARGPAAQLIGAGYMSRKQPYRIEPDRSYKVRVALWRFQNTIDPAGNTVRIGIIWLDCNYVKLGTVALEDINDLGTSKGRIVREYPVPMDGRTSDMVYARPFVRTFGADGTTRVEIIDLEEVHDAEDFIGVATTAANGTHSRPGDPGDYFGHQSDGRPGDIVPLGSDEKRATVNGAVAIMAAANRLALRVPVRIEPARSYKARFTFLRALDVTDPSNDTVRLALAWLDGNFNTISNMLFEDFNTLVASDGRVQRAYSFPSADFPRPPGAVYARPYVRTFGADGVTYIEIVGISDVTDNVDFSPDLDAIEATIATMQTQIDEVGDTIGADALFTGDLAGLTIANRGAADADIAAARAPIFTKRERPMLGNYPIVLGGAVVRQDVLNNGDEGYNSLADSGSENQSWIGWTSLTWTLPGTGDAGDPKWLIPFTVQDIPVDIRDGMIVLHIKELQNVWNSPTGQIDRLIIRLYSEGWPDPAHPSIDDLPDNYLELPEIYPDFYAGHVTNGAGEGWYHKYMTPANSYVAVGTPDPTAIRYAALGFRGAAGATVKLATGLVQFVPNALDRAKCVWRVDDGKKGHYVDMAREFARHGFPLEHHPGAIGVTIRDDDNSFESSYMIKQMHDLHGHQIGAQTWDDERLSRIEDMNDGQRAAFMAKARAWAASMGVTGDETGTYYSEVGYQVGLAREMFRTHFAEVLMFGGGYSLPAPAPFTYGEMYPWGDPMAVRCLTIENPDWDTDEKVIERVMAHVNQAIANKGVALFALHDYYRFQTAFPAILAKLDALRDQIDVCTIQDIKAYPRADLGGRTVSTLISNPVKVVPRPPLLGRIAAIGDDLLADSIDQPADGWGGWQLSGFLSYMLAGLGQKLYMPPAANLGVYAQTVAQTADDSNLDAVIAYRPKVVVLSAGARSPYQPIYETEDYFRHIYGRLNAAGIIVIHGTPLPDSTLDATGEAHRQVLRRFILSRKSPMMIPVDLESVVVPGTHMRSNLLLNSAGAYLVGMAYATALDAAIEQGDILPLIDPRHTGNPTMSGDSGGVATGWALTTSNAGGATVATAKVTEPGGNVAQRVIVSGSKAGTGKDVTLSTSSTTGLPEVGDVLQGIIDLELTGTLTNITSIGIDLQVVNTDFSLRINSDSMFNAASVLLPAALANGRLRYATPAFIVPDQAGKTIGSVTTNIIIRLADGSVSVAATAKIWFAGACKVRSGT